MADIQRNTSLLETVFTDITNTQKNTSFFESVYTIMSTDYVFELDYISDPYANIVINYVFPVLIFITIVTNTLVLVVLLKKHMRSPTNFFLAGIAFSDMLTGLPVLPAWLYFFVMGNDGEYVPYNWCFAFDITTHLLPMIFHTASIWITMLLTVQRYIYVCHDLKARRWPFTITRVVYCIIAIYVVSILSHITTFIISSFIPVEVASRLDPNQTVVTCIHEYSAWVMDHLYLYFTIYNWFKIICVNLIPCTVLVVLNTLLISTLRSAERRRILLLNRNERRLSMKLKESNSTTRMLVVVVSLFLLVEIPVGTFRFIRILTSTFEISIIPTGLYTIISTTSNAFVLLSLPFNMCIYCGMSRQFRATFKQLFHCLNIN